MSEQWEPPRNIQSLPNAELVALHGPMRFLRAEGENLVFWFVCEGCHAEGELMLDGAIVREDQRARKVGCPEGCGALYLLWKNPLKGGSWDLQCVVAPVFVDEEDEE